MAWHEQGPSGNYFICLRVGEKRFRRSIKTTSKEDADGDLARIEDNLRHVERGWHTILHNVDVVAFLLSTSRVSDRALLQHARRFEVEILRLARESLTETAIQLPIDDLCTLSEP